MMERINSTTIPATKPAIKPVCDFDDVGARGGDEVGLAVVALATPAFCKDEVVADEGLVEIKEDVDVATCIRGAVITVIVSTANSEVDEAARVFAVDVSEVLGNWVLDN
jgi:hypothetical protein